ncbi:hypothetical protein BBJ28_00017481 [Nothophytophthora sp. Chile5]|nr:hypothetical protein BBJ28_00017481 [Nothophytophthora sp. Chile5]
MAKELLARVGGSGGGRLSFSRNAGRWRLNPSASFDNAVLRELPVDPEPQNFVRSAVVGACFSRVTPTPIASPELVIASHAPLALAGIELLEEAEGDEHAETQPLASLVPFLAGNALLNGSEPAAQCYCGHQFGFFSGQLGDGAAVYLGEVAREDGLDRWELQLKGSGLTPYSRTADGRKVLRSTLREFLCSEHMHALGVPTTRAGSVVLSRETQVLRDVFYDGHAAMEPTAVVTRIARSFLRFGSFEIFKDTDKVTGLAGPSAQLEDKADRLRQMLDFTIRQYFLEIEGDDDDLTKYERFFAEVVRRTAKLAAKWQTLGFCHGVLNTDNMSILGDTLDYGPFGFMEHFDPKYVCNTSDGTGRYRYEAQPEICKWNCGVLADQLEPIVPRDGLETGLAAFDGVYEDEYMRLMRQKLGLTRQEGGGEEDEELVGALVNVLTRTGADFTCVFRCLSSLNAFDSVEIRDQAVDTLVGLSETLEQQKRKLEAASSGLSEEQYEMVELLLKNSPARARQYGITPEVFAQMTAQREAKAALDATTDTQRLETVRTAWRDWIIVYIGRVQRDGDAENEEKRLDRMRRVNPVFVLRNHVAQTAIDLAHEGDYAGVQHIFDLLMHPFDEPIDEDDRRFARPQDPSTAPLCVSCSS